MWSDRLEPRRELLRKAALVGTAGASALSVEALRPDDALAATNYAVLGTDGSVGGPGGSPLNSSIEVMVLPSGDTSGATDTTNINAALSASSIARLAKGTYYSTGITLTPGQSLCGPGAGLTTLKKVGSSTGPTVYAHDSSFSYSSLYSSPAGEISGLTIDGTSAAASSQGLEFGDLMGGVIRDVTIQNFSQTGSVGMWFNSTVGWAEQMDVQIRTVNNTINILFDNHSQYGSFDYSTFDLHIVAFANQHGIVIQTSKAGCPLAMVGDQIKATGNFQSGSSNTGIALLIAGGSSNSTDMSAVQAAVLDITFETDGTSGVAHQTISMGSAGAFQGVGLLNFLAGNSLAWAAGTVYRQGSTHFAVSGYINVDANLGVMVYGQSHDVVGAATQNQGYASSGSKGLIYLSGGNYFPLLLSTGSNALTFSGAPVGHSGTVEIVLTQPSSGASGTVSWPSSVKWPGGVTPTLSTANGAIDRIRLVTLDYQTFYGELVGKAYAV